MAHNRHILVFRFSALGDVAMTVPVIKNLLVQHPDITITVVAAPFAQPLFDGIERIVFYGVDTKKYKGLGGLYRLAKEIKKSVRFDVIADLHNVLRTKMLRFFLGGPSAKIDKGRREKKELTRPYYKILRQLPATFERYAAVFARLGFPVNLDKQSGIQQLASDNSLLPFPKENRIIIGIAPFAKHAAKMYPLHKMKSVIDMLVQHENVRIILFTSKSEIPAIAEWLYHPAVTAAAANHTFKQELNIMSQLNLMLSMDSANMHLASLYGVPVVSIWGGTHPFLGFYGWGQDNSNILQLDLPCRPSSVFGNKQCPVHGAAGCMQEITPQMVYEKIHEVLSEKVL